MLQRLCGFSLFYTIGGFICSGHSSKQIRFKIAFSSEIIKLKEKCNQQWKLTLRIPRETEKGPVWSLSCAQAEKGLQDLSIYLNNEKSVPWEQGPAGLFYSGITTR